MIGIAHLLDDFAPLLGRSSTPQPAPEELSEEAHLAAFETGYKAGWADAIKNQAAEGRSITADLALNLQDLSFTYREAYGHVMGELAPLLEQMARTVLPHAARAALVPRIVEEIMEMAAICSGEPRLELSVAPASRAVLEPLLGDALAFPLDIRADDALGEGQVRLRLAQAEREIDLGAVVEGIDQALAGLIHDMQKE